MENKINLERLQKLLSVLVLSFILCGGVCRYHDYLTGHTIAGSFDIERGDGGFWGLGVTYDRPAKDMKELWENLLPETAVKHIKDTNVMAKAFLGIYDGHVFFTPAGEKIENAAEYMRLRMLPYSYMFMVYIFSLLYVFAMPEIRGKHIFMFTALAVLIGGVLGCNRLTEKSFYKNAGQEMLAGGYKYTADSWNDGVSNYYDTKVYSPDGRIVYSSGELPDEFLTTSGLSFYHWYGMHDASSCSVTDKNFHVLVKKGTAWNCYVDEVCGIPLIKAYTYAFSDAHECYDIRGNAVNENDYINNRLFPYKIMVYGYIAVTVLALISTKMLKTGDRS